MDSNCGEAKARVVLVVDGPEVVVVRLPKDKKRRVVVSSEEEDGSGEEGRDKMRLIVPLGHRNRVLLGLASKMGGRRVPGNAGGYVEGRERWVANKFRFGNRSLLGRCSRMVGDFYYTRGKSIGVLVERVFRGVGRGRFPCH